MTRAWLFRAPCPMSDGNGQGYAHGLSWVKENPLWGAFAGTFGKEAMSSSARAAKLTDWKPGTFDSLFFPNTQNHQPLPEKKPMQKKANQRDQASKQCLKI